MSASVIFSSCTAWGGGGLLRVESWERDWESNCLASIDWRPCCPRSHLWRGHGLKRRRCSLFTKYVYMHSNFEFFLEQNFFWSDFWISPLSFLFFYTILGLISTESYKEFFGTKSTAFSVLFTLFTCFLWAHAKQANTNRPKTVLKKIWITR